MRLAKLARTLCSLLIFIPLSALSQTTPTAAQPATDEPVITLERFVAEENKDDPNRIVPNAPTSSILGISRSLYDTPRAATNISSEFIETMAIRNSEDIARIAPSTFSNYRFGLQGNVSVRNQTSDFYFRGMRRIDPQGNYRTIFAANDSIEIVRGPPSPVYGLGRIGGYLNFNPKTARLEKTGKYLDRPTGSITYTYGSYDKNVVTLDVGGPVSIAGRNGGYQVFGYYENSDSYWLYNPRDKHEIVQATLTLDLSDSWRLETGGVAQHSFGGLPGGINRTTQNLVDNGKYWTGTFSYNLDQNGDGRISDIEVLRSYYGNGNEQFRGGATTAPGNLRHSNNYVGQVNAPLNRRVPWQGGPVNGGKITVDQFLAGYVDTAGNQRQGYQLRVFPVGTNSRPNTSVPQTEFYMPAAFDPALGSWQEVDFDYRRSFGEDYYEAYVYTFFFDLVNDSDPDFTYKNQILLDTQDQEKTGRNPFSQYQNIFRIEDKITLTKVWRPRWDWVEITTLGSVNGVYYDGGRRTDNTVDYDYRRSLMTGFTPNDTFSAFTKNSGLEGSALSQFQHSSFTQWGVGTLADLTFFKKLSLLVGGRFDSMDAEAYIPAGVFNRNGNGSLTVASTNPAFKGYSDYAKANDSGYTYSGSLSYEVVRGVRPYVTYAIASAPIDDASTGGIPIANVRRGPFGEAKLTEFGVKTTHFNNKLFTAMAYYEQTRNNFDASDGAGSIGATEGKGFEAEVRWSPNRKFSLTAGLNASKTINLPQPPGTPFNVTASARFLGFPDVVDATGKVVIPAEAFGWGGILQTAIPGDDTDYNEVQGIPNTVWNVTGIYTFDNNITVRLTGYYQGGFSPDRLKTVSVPPAFALDGSIGYTWDDKKWDIRLNLVNITDETYYNGGSFSSVAQRLPFSFDITLKRSF